MPGVAWPVLTTYWDIKEPLACQTKMAVNAERGRKGACFSASEDQKNHQAALSTHAQAKSASLVVGLCEQGPGETRERKRGNAEHVGGS